MMKKFALLLGLILGLGLSAQAQTTVALMPIPKPQFFGQNGLPLAGCKIFTYQSGTSTPQGTFFDSGGTISNPNPVTCDAGGFVSIWLIVGNSYRILVQDQFGVQQYLTDGVVGVGGGTLSLFSTPNTWTALQTFPGGINASGGGTLSGAFTGSPSFSGTPQFTTFTISNATVIANLNASLWNGTSVNAGGALTTGFVPVVSAGGAATWNNLPSIAGVATTSQLPGSGNTTVGSSICTIGASCTLFNPTVVYSTASASSSANIALTTMTTVGASNATYRLSFYISTTVVGAGCTGSTTVNLFPTWTDPLAAGASTGGAIQEVWAITSNAGPGSFNGQVGPAAAWLDNAVGAQLRIPWIIRAKAGTLISYTGTYQAGGGCAPSPSYQVFPILEQLTAN